MKLFWKAAAVWLIALVSTPLVITPLVITPLAADQLSLFRIGTGGIGATYYPIAGLVAQAISNPAGHCEPDEICGVPGLVAVAQSSSGSVANVRDIAGGRIESGFVQSDVAFWAYSGVGAFSEEGRQTSLRAIANLYPESFHIVVRKDSGIETVRDLSGHRVAIDEAGSGTLVGAKLVLEAFGLDGDAVSVTYLKSDDAIEKLVDGELDAFFLIAGYPAKVIEWASEQTAIRLLPIDGPETEELVRLNPFLQTDFIPAATYDGISQVPTLTVAAQWVTRDDISDETIYGILEALWRSDARRLLDRGHAQGRVIRLETALEGVGIPLHAGALRFYRDVGVLQRQSERLKTTN
ncbi:TAXI family TRAP transporter solute-binding subunit [Pelagibius sp.]|uniref:TAXI family TRAP transporter solute-binding subunit n=1 Tax=Pelagibius sp. TaxID=1931238 RepID=UPI00262B5627|nr:TAXI family TRAP transporter solute-binding subunit [Pelagibius sp.]